MELLGSQNQGLPTIFKAGLAIVITWFVVCLSLAGGIIYATVHFLSKVW